jgi:2-phosphosulfolactate phosphatase
VLGAVSDVPAAVRGSTSVRELTVGGLAADVEVAVQVGTGEVVPGLRDGVFGPAA